LILFVPFLRRRRTSSPLPLLAFPVFIAHTLAFGRRGTFDALIPEPSLLVDLFILQSLGGSGLRISAVSRFLDAPE
jgi:hypothetical protein